MYSITQFIDTICTVEFFHQVFALNLVLTHSRNFFIVTTVKESQAGTISARESFCNQFSSWQFCWNCGIDTLSGNYAGGNVFSLTASFHKIDQKTFRGIISGFHFTTFANILLKLRNFEGKDYIQIGYLFSR